MADVPKLSAFSTLASGITAGASSLTVQSGHGARFPDTATDGAFNVCIYDSRYKNFDVAYRAGMGEVVRVTSRSSDTFTITRAQEGTSAVAFNTTGVTYRVEQNITPVYLTARDLPSQTGNGGKYLQTSGTSASWAVVPNIVSCTFTGTNAGVATKYTTFGSEAQLSSDAIRIPLPFACTIDDLYVRADSKSGGGDSSVTVMKNGSATDLTVNCENGTVAENTTDSVDFIAGDVVSVRLSVPGTDTVVNVGVSARLRAS